MNLCAPGSYSTGHAPACTSCPSGFRCPFTDSAVVVPCTNGSYSLGNQVTIQFNCHVFIAIIFPQHVFIADIMYRVSTWDGVSFDNGGRVCVHSWAVFDRKTRHVYDLPSWKCVRLRSYVYNASLEIPWLKPMPLFIKPDARVPQQLSSSRAVKERMLFLERRLVMRARQVMNVLSHIRTQ